ncbi:hypothetical protein DPMN_002731 [Dreissena polymorpha]|uniref:Uncharacterized protein n=1 Tax=Dreissena polymorpha TaxID=45954 RepID=A0A9D4MNP9_DREPO|nr:hypothetical protein DPMN_002731 [Dreissena polymorpha]
MINLSSDNHLVDGPTDRPTDMSKAIYPLFFSKAMERQLAQTDRQTDQPTNRQGKNNMSPTTIFFHPATFIGGFEPPNAIHAIRPDLGGTIFHWAENCPLTFFYRAENCPPAD